uniref:TPR_REGION domain-containing protein n=1 Tax=Caenorhabditis tropicalis TaxID=1561998 RepID=A0A1I7V217_9PELO
MALEDCDKCIELNYANCQVHNQKAAVYFELTEYARGELSIRQALEVDENDTTANQLLGKLREKQREFQNALPLIGIAFNRRQMSFDQFLLENPATRRVTFVEMDIKWKSYEYLHWLSVFCPPEEFRIKFAGKVSASDYGVLAEFRTIFCAIHVAKQLFDMGLNVEFSAHIPNGRQLYRCRHCSQSSETKLLFHTHLQQCQANPAQLQIDFEKEAVFSAYDEHF